MARVPREVAALLGEPRSGRRIAVVGASNAPHKYGSIILLDLVAKGFEVIPINPHTDAAHGLDTYATVSDAPGPIDIVDFVVPPAVSLEVVRDLDEERFPVLWFQPGSFDRRVLDEAKRFRHVVAGPCIMVEAP